MPPIFKSNSGLFDPRVTPKKSVLSVDPFPTFSNLPFNMFGGTHHFIGDVHVNYFSSWLGLISLVLDSDFAVPQPPTTPAQYGELQPLQFAPGFFVKWVADLGPDPMDSFFPALGTLSDAASTAYNIGFTRPAAGVTKTGRYVMQGIDTDGTTVLAQATYTVIYERP